MKSKVMVMESESMMQTHVSLEIAGPVATLLFACDAPEKPVTLDHTVLAELDACLDEILAGVEALRAVIVRSCSAKYFIVGANIRALQEQDAATIVPWVRHGHAVFNKLAGLPLPVLARVEGFALGGGLELALACDLILATETARFGQPEAKLGFVAGWGGSHRLPARIGVARAKELFFTGKIIDAETAAQIGLADFVGDPAALDAHISELLAGIQTCSPEAVAQMKQLVDSSAMRTIEESALAEAVASSECLASDETQARVAEFLTRSGRS